MPNVHRFAIVSRPPGLLFDLVDGVERYPEFLPWCSSTTLFERTEVHTHARIDVDYHGLKTHFRTINRKVTPESMRLELLEGPFERFDGHWRFVALGTEGCRVEFELDYDIGAGALEVLLRPVFEHVVGTLVDRFVARAEGSA